MGDSGHWRTFDRFYSYTPETFTKRELRPSERRTNWQGEIVKMPWTTERLQNEFDALMFISTNTTIPVPEVLSFGSVWGSYQLEMKRVNGKPLHRLKTNKAEALKNVTHFITTSVIPQLQALKSSHIGSISGIVIPPNRITTRDKRPLWPSKSSSISQFGYCHNDLAQHNIMVNLDTLQVEAIIDWEYSGFFPSEFEAPLWTKSSNEPGYHDMNAQQVDSLIKFLEDPGENHINSSKTHVIISFRCHRSIVIGDPLCGHTFWLRCLIGSFHRNDNVEC